MENSAPRRSSCLGDIGRLGLALLIMYVLVEVFVFHWPPASIVRRDQRKMVMERVQASGGWTALQEACDGLVETNRESGLQWYHGHDMNALPPAIEALKPKEVWFDPPSLEGGSNWENEPFVVDIKIFGLHATGGDAYPYFGLEFVSGTNANRYTPHLVEAASGNSYDSYRKITNRIYEITGPR